MSHTNGEPTVKRRTVLGAAGIGLGALSTTFTPSDAHADDAAANKAIDVDFDRSDLIVGTFFTASTEPASATDPHRPIDKRIGMYATNASNPTDFTYLGETGLTGRDSSIAFRDDVFYVLTTADEREEYAVNIFKSTDLVTWTNPQSCRYEIHTSEPKRNGAVYNWGPKWVEDTLSPGPDNIYIIVSLESTEPRITHGLLPFNPYPIMNTYIIPVTGWHDRRSTSINAKTLSFGHPQRVNWGEGVGVSHKIYNGQPEQISRIGAYVDIDRHNKAKYGFRYIMFAKVDPWGNIEAWGSDDLLAARPWVRLAHGLFYDGRDDNGPSAMVQAFDEIWKVRRLFEGNYPIHVGATTYLYSDNYSYKATGLLTDGGMYFLRSSNYLEGFNNPRPITTSNTDARASGLRDYVTRNATIKPLPDGRARQLVKDFSVNVVFYSTRHSTTKPVTATIRANDYLAPVTGWTLAENRMRLSKVFTRNGTEQVQLRTESGEVLQSVTVEVNNIASR